MTRVLVISFTDLVSDPRVDRQIAALSARHEIVAAGLGPPRYPVNEFIEIPTPERTMPGKAVGLVRLITRRYDDVYWTHPAHVAALNRLRGVQADAVVANDLEVLPLAISLRSPVVLDAHEYAPGQLTERAWWRALIAPYLRWQCRRYIPQVASMTTVSEGIAAAYERDTGVHASVVTNAPPRADLMPTPVHEPIRILHHGGAMAGRGLEEMVRLGDLLDDRFRLDFVLVEAQQGYREKLIRRAHGHPRIRFPEAWPMLALAQRANDYDIGLFLLPPVNVNRRFALPNKFFEFIQARLAVAIGPSPEMARVVRRYGCGVVSNDFTPESMAEALNDLDSASIASFKESSHLAAEELSAERNAKVLLNSVEEALAYRPSSVARR